MKISNITASQSFGVDMGMNVSSIVKTALFHSYTSKKGRIKETEDKIEKLKNMKNNYVLTTYRDRDNRGDIFCYQMTPRGYCKSASETICKLPAEMPPLIVLAKLLKAVENYEPKFVPEKYQ